jgi:DNA polymerase-3 subunit gamma/tau
MEEDSKAKHAKQAHNNTPTSLVGREPLLPIFVHISNITPMSEKYQVLARKYRPQTFAEVVGQQSAVTTLKNAIRFEKIAHAYLFCGTRGVGKTTLARLFAKALNCHSLTPDLEPCGNCSSCIDTTSGQSLDVIEIDGASNRGIDDIRQINETVGYAPSHGRYKIYIIDEVHMLTKEAFNALLKTLEEPPLTAKFFFATTEPHKVLPTIISRCQRFDLSRISPLEITEKLQQIAQDLSRTIDPDALDLIATFADGSLRDAESLFDQILCFANEHISSDTIRQSLGLVPQELFFQLDKAFSTYNLGYAFELVEQLFLTGKDLSHFLEQLVQHYRTLTLIRTLGEKTELSAYSASARLYTQQQCLHILDLLITAESTFQKSPFPRISLESILLQIIRSKHRIPVEAIVRKLTENPPDLTLAAPPSQSEPKYKETIEPISDISKEPPIVTTPTKLPVDTPKETPQEKEETIEIPSNILKRKEVIEAVSDISKEPLIVTTPTKLPVDTPKETPREKEETIEIPSNILKRKEVIEAVSDISKEPPIVNALRHKESITSISPATPKPVAAVKSPLAESKKTSTEAKPVSSSPSGKHPSTYDTLLRFASIELEGTVKN